MPSESLVDLPVNEQGIDLSGLGFFDLYGLIWFDGFDVGDFEFEQVSGSDSVVDAHSEKEKVTGF